jgi:hypothetical protein
VLPGPDKHSRPHLPKTTAIFEAFTATFAKNHGHFRSFHGHLSKNLPLHGISKHNNNKKPKKHNVWGGILSFFLFLLSISALNITQIFEIKLDLYHSTLLLLTATFTATNFSTQIIFYTVCFELFSATLLTEDSSLHRCCQTAENSAA